MAAAVALSAAASCSDRPEAESAPVPGAAPAGVPAAAPAGPGGEVRAFTGAATKVVWVQEATAPTRSLPAISWC